MKTKGWKKVFAFTFIQHVKTKSFIIGTIVVCLITALLTAGVNILPKLLGDEEDISSDGQGELKFPAAVYLYDNCSALTEEDLISIGAAGVTLKESELNNTDMIDTLAKAEAGEAMVCIDTEVIDGIIVGYKVKTYYSPDTEGEQVDGITGLISRMVDYRNLVTLGISPEDYAASQRYVSTAKITAGADEWNVLESAINYVVPLVSSLVLFMLIFVYGQTVAQSIATEKTSRVMELLLTSVRPLAVVIGKVLAMGLVSIMQFILIILVGSVSFMVSAPFGIGGEVMQLLSSPELQTGTNAEIVEAINNTVGGINPFTIVMIFVIFILGFMFYALIAALAGASISRMEDLAQALQPLNLLGVLGFYLAYFPIIFNVESVDTGAAANNPIQIFSYYFPVSSPFALPSALMLGNMSVLETAIATLILAVFVVLIAMLVAKVYEAIILHNGNRLKITDMLKMAKSK